MVQNFDGNAYDVVIGSGLSGLTAAAYLARAGHRVVVLEQAQSAGGFAHAFRRGDYILDPALHYTQEVKDDEVVGVMLRQLGIRDQLQFLEGDYHYQVRFPDFSLCVPVGAQNLIEAHVNRFPRCADGIRKFFRLCGQMHAEAHDVPMQAGLKGLDELARQFPILFKYQRATLAEVLEEFVDDPHARAACCAAWPWLGLPPSTCSFLTFAQLLSVMIQGTYFCVGGFQVVVDAMVAAIEEKGGTFLLGQAAKQILLREGKVVGVCTQDGTEIPARSVIATGSARLMYRDMVGYDHLPPGFVRRLERMEPSVSAFIVFAATDADLGARGLPPEVFLYGSWDQDENFGETMADKPEAFWLSIPTVIDPSLAPPGKHIVACTVVADFRHDPPWNTVRKQYAETILERVRTLAPDIGEGLTVLETSTPEAFERYLMSEGGSSFGWALTTNQVGSRRLPPEAPIEGLYLAGHWTQPGHGSLRAMVSGCHAAQTILHRCGEPVPEIPLSILSRF